MYTIIYFLKNMKILSINTQLYEKQFVFNEKWESKLVVRTS